MTQFSHPQEPIRHSYPLHIKNSSFATSAGLFLKTMPYTLTRFGILFGISIAIVLWTLFSIFISGVVAKLSEGAGAITFIVLVGFLGGVWRFFARYILYIIKCGHISVLTELITSGKIANGQENMFQYGKNTVTQRFKEVNVLFVVDALVKGAVGAFNRTLDWITSFLPIPGIEKVTQLVNAIIRAATVYIDEAIFSYNLARGDENVWRSSTDAVVYYAQNSKEILKTAIFIVILDRVLSFFAWVFFLIPALMLTNVLPDFADGWGTIMTLVVAISLALNFRSAVLKPLFLTMILVKFHSVVSGQEINSAWDQKLSSASGKFVELKDKAAGWVRGDVATPQASVPVTPVS